MNKFYIDIAYVTDVTVRTEHWPTQRADESSEDFLIRKLTHVSGTVVSISNKDHDEFTKLREQLGEEGYITIQRGWWNGDRVVKPFYLNDVKFKKGDKFCCASAMKYTLEYGKVDK